MKTDLDLSPVPKTEPGEQMQKARARMRELLLEDLGTAARFEQEARRLDWLAKDYRERAEKVLSRVRAQTEEYGIDLSE